MDQAHPPRAHSPPLVLVVDDTPADRDLHALLLRRRGLQVITAADGVEALCRARALLPDLVVSDVRMPRMDGCELVQRLRSDAATAAIPVVLVTADLATVATAGLAASGLLSFVEKPVDFALFRGAACAALRLPEPAAAG